MSEIINEILVVEMELPWGWLSDWDKDKIEEMRVEYIKSCVNLKLINSLTLTGVMKAVWPEGHEEKNIQIKI